jgi:oligoribonuclease NrnB/cAMP/cGMP phosphodiesterase (DHH superfamily)
MHDVFRSSLKSIEIINFRNHDSFKISDLGNKLANKPLKNGNLPDFGVVWNYNVDTQTWFVSLRGHDDSPDLSVIAKHFGGGGHEKAAGFRIEYPNTLLSIFIINNNT